MVVSCSNHGIVEREVGGAWHGACVRMLGTQ